MTQNFFDDFAKSKGISVSELIVSSVIERIEDEYDLIACEKALAAYKENPITYTQEEVMKILDIEL